MSYCRFIENDAYMYWSVEGYVTCCGCHLESPDPRFTKFSDAISHLAAHRLAGDRIQDYAFDGLRAEIEEHGDEVPQD